MVKMNGLLVVLAAFVVVLGGFCAAETYHLGPGGDWQNVADMPEGEYLLAVSKIKQQIQTGNNAAVMDALEKLKSDFPDLAGAQIDAFIAAEKIYANGKLSKAAVKYKQFLDAWPDSVLYPVAMERLFSIGVAYLQGQKRTFLKVLRLPAFDDGVNLMWDIADRAGNSPIALRALTTLAENQERRKQYFDAYQTWAEIATRWPTGKTGQDALIRMAQELHASYSGPQYDSGALQSARSYYEDFITRYPALAEKLDVETEQTLIIEQLAYKQYETGFYYERTDKPEVAKVYYEKVLADWPDSKAAIMATARLTANAPPAVKQTKRRKLFDIGNAFLDSWFGVEKLHDKMMESQNKKDSLQ
ncbi:MAG: tetratricopeptide repeat protein [Phycisphaerae bacterium]|nr:tetratricopeptide repeat protein [Phycisphaerae bacterium]